MSENELSSDCDQISRSQRRRLEYPSNDAHSAKESKLEKLPSECLHHILSLMNYEKVSQMRQVSQRFNEISKNLLDNGQRELKKRLTREIEIAEKMVLFPNNAKSYALSHFLTDLHEAVSNCTKAYLPHVNFFVAGKLLDEVNCLLTDFRSSTMVPYLPEDIYDQQPHPLLIPIAAQSEKAYRHFYRKILGKFINRDEKADFERLKASYLQAILLTEQNKIRVPKINLLKNQRRKIDCGNQMHEDLLKLIFKLNEDVLSLTQWAKKVGEEVERTISGVGMFNKSENNCLFQFSTNLLLRDTKVIRNPGLKQINLTTLPSTCIQNIVSYLSCNKMAQLRIVCKSFNEVCKKELDQEFKKLNQKFVFQIKCNEQTNMHFPYNREYVDIYLMKDLYSLLVQCKDIYKYYMGSNYYFAAGKVLDEAKHMYFKGRFDLDFSYKSTPHYALFPLTKVVCKTIAHFKFNVAPKYFPLSQKRVYVSDYIIFGDAINFEDENQLNLEDIEMLIKTTDVKIKEQNDRNKTLRKILSSLEKKIFILNKEISERINVLKNLK